MRLCFSPLLLPLFSLALTVFVVPSNSTAQQTGRRYLFREDTRDVRLQEEKTRGTLLTSTSPDDTSIDVSAPNIEFSREANVVDATGGVILSRGGVAAQAEKAQVDLENNEAELYGNVIVSQDQGNFKATSALINFDSETGVFNDTNFVLESGQIFCSAETALKYAETKYRLTDFSLTTCGCRDGTTPWRIVADEADLTEEGYAHTYGTSLELYGVPVFYSPYFSFPIKRERATGLLVPTYGLSSQDGVRFKQPFFLVLDDSTDILFTPFVETSTRVGAATQFRKLLSKNHSIRSKVVVSNETWRGDSLRGIVKTPENSPQVDENRLGLFHSQIWRGDSQAAVPLSFLADIHYTSDDQVLRELPDEDIGLFSARYLSSTAALRAGVGSYMNAELSSEYNQSIDGDIKESDDQLFQRLPEVSIGGLRSFRPLGTNPFGIKLVTKGGVSATQFSRSLGYEGSRVNINPIVEVPFRYKNYFNSQLQVQGIGTYYDVSSLQETDLVGDTPSRQTAVASYTLATGVEKTYDVADDDLIARLVAIGSTNQLTTLVRTKHVVEPFTQYTYAPDRDPDNLPFFDSLDRVRQRSIVTYGVTTSLLGRFMPVRDPAYPIPELVPMPEDLPQIGFLESLPTLPFGPTVPDSGPQSALRLGEIRRLLSVTLKQSFDILENREDLDPAREPLSDLGLGATLEPNKTFSFAFDSNYGIETQKLSSWAGTFFMVDDRDDLLRLRYTYIDPTIVSNGLIIPGVSVSNIEASLEGVITDRFKVGYFARFDETAKQMIEQAAVFRIMSACNCWALDLGVSERTNPNREQFNVRFSFSGLGDITQDLFRRNTNNVLHSQPNKEKQRVLVTGAAGFIGSNFLHFIDKNRPDWNVVALDLLTYAGNLENIANLVESKKVKFVRGDIADRALLKGLFEDPFDYVFHFAAESHVDRSIHSAEEFVKTNVLGTEALLSAAREVGVKRFVHVSTDEVYGSLGQTGVFYETTPLDPTSPYSSSKAASDLIALSFEKTYGLDVCVTRCTNNYGPYQFPEKFIPLFISNALDDKKLPVYGDGLQVRSWLHVDDHCDALLRVAEHGRKGEVYNIGGGDEGELPNIEVAKRILAALKKPESLLAYVTDRPAHDRRYAVDTTKLRTETGWEPKVAFEVGLEKTVAWFIENREWWDRIKGGEYRTYYEKHYGNKL